MPREIKALEPALLESHSFDQKHTILFNEQTHRYKLDGIACRGVTTAIKGGYPTNMGLISWMKGKTAEAIFNALTVPVGKLLFGPREAIWPISEDRRIELVKEAKLADRDFSQDAADIGTVLHEFAELWGQGNRTEAHAILQKAKSLKEWPLIDSCVQSYLTWHTKHIGEVISAEGIVGSPMHRVCGKFDLLEKANGRLILYDYKTSKGIFIEHKLQLALYRVCIREWMNLNVDELHILRFGKDAGDFEPLAITDLKVIHDLEEQALRCLGTSDFIKLYDAPKYEKAA
jgi:hypothetical protein